MDCVLDLQDVRKTYGKGKKRVDALRGVSLQVRPGEIFGLLGPNGAGKSTLVKIMMSVVKPTHAVGNLLGHPVGHKPTLRKVGYLPEHHRFPRYLTGRQLLVFFGALAGVDSHTGQRRAAELLQLVGMKDWGDRRIDSYSKGMMQRVGVAQALMNSPDLVVLDEPTDGVDPIGRKDMRDVLLRIKAEGRTVFVNSHLLSELEIISDRVAIMVKGQVVRQGTIAELAQKRQWFEIDLLRTLPPAAAQSLALAPSAEPGLLKATQPDGIWLEAQSAADLVTLRIGTADPTRIQPLLDSLRAAGAIITRIALVRPSLEDMFMEAVTDPSRGTGVPPVVNRNTGVPPVFPGNPIAPPALPTEARP